jgi:predicted small lipoprotein YifL
MFFSSIKIILLLTVCSGLFSACGQKGPLYIPKETYNAAHAWSK